MLTKTLLKYSVRGERIFPKYLGPGEKKFRDLAAEIIQIFSSSIGLRLKDLQDAIKQHQLASDLVFQGLCKILEDRLSFEVTSSHFEVQRWELFKQAKYLRLRGFSEIIDFQTTLAEENKKNFSEISNQLFGDLEEFKIISRLEPIDSETLIHRYNLSQIQGLLIRSQSIQLSIRNQDLSVRRRFLQKLKFYQLLVEIKESQQSEVVVLNITGPLSIFEQSQSYGVRISNFFPYILLLSDWTLEASIILRDKKILMLEINSERRINSQYSDLGGHIPEEFRLIIEAFKEAKEEDAKGWNAEYGEENLNLGSGYYCLPDISFRHISGKIRHLELFHRWHKTDLKKRLEAGLRSKNQEIIFGISNEIFKKKEVEDLILVFQEQGLNIFSFRQFPTFRAIMAQLEKVL